MMFRNFLAFSSRNQWARYILDGVRKKRVYSFALFTEHDRYITLARGFRATPILHGFKVWRVGKDKYENLPVQEYLIAAWNVDIKKMQKRMNIKPILALDVKIDIRPRLEIIVEAGVIESKLGKILMRQPRILLVNIPDLLIRINTLRNIGIHSDDIPRIIEESPAVLTNMIEKSLTNKVTFFENINVQPSLTSDDILSILTRCPEIISSCTLKALEEKMCVFSDEIKADKQQLRNLIYRQPEVLTFSPGAILEKYKYCRNEMGLKKAHIMRCPRAFMCSIKRIRDRHLFLKELELLKEDTPIDDFGLGIIVTYSDKKFVETAKSTLEDFQRFTKKLGKKLKQKDEKAERERQWNADLINDEQSVKEINGMEVNEVHQENKL